MGTTKYLTNHLRNFCDIYNLSYLAENPTCFKFSEKLFFMNLFFKYWITCFLNKAIIETYISDFYIVVITMIRINYN